MMDEVVLSHGAGQANQTKSNTGDGGATEGDFAMFSFAPSNTDKVENNGWCIGLDSKDTSVKPLQRDSASATRGNVKNSATVRAGKINERRSGTAVSSDEKDSKINVKQRLGTNANENDLVNGPIDERYQDDETPKIKQISSSSIKRLVAGQAVTDLSSAVKELVDNAIDAGASRVNVRLYNQGLDAIEVSDNGSGVPKSSRPLMAMKHATSKLKSFEDLYSSSNGLEDSSQDDPAFAAAPTLGFRGEALFCLANLSRSLVVSTRTAEDVKLGEQFLFDHDGSLIQESIQLVPRSIGTTVTVNGLFEPLPVRRVDMNKRIKQQRMKLMKLLQGYAILCLGTQFNFTDVQSSNRKSQNASRKSKSEVRLATSESSNTLEKRTASILGTKFLSGLTRIEVDLHSAVEAVDPGHTETKISTNQPPRWKMEGLVSHAPTAPKPPTARDMQFYSINGRPVDLPSVSRALGDVWRSFDPSAIGGGSGHGGGTGSGGSRRRPACILAFTLPKNMYDVNLSPDKREVMLTEEIIVSESIREGLMTLWSGQSEGKFAANEVESRSNCGQDTRAKESEKDMGLGLGCNSSDGTAFELKSQKEQSEESTKKHYATPRPSSKRQTLVGIKDPENGKDLNTAPLQSTNDPINGALITPLESDTPTNEEESIQQSSRVLFDSKSDSGASFHDKNEHSQLGTSFPGNGLSQSRTVEGEIRQDRRGWEQMRLNFRRIEKQQLSKEIKRVLSSEQEVDESNKNSDITAVDQTDTQSMKKKRNLRETTDARRPKRQKRGNHDAASFLDNFAFGSKNSVVEDDQEDYQEDDSDATESDSDNFSQSKEVSGRSGRMIVGRTIKAPKNSNISTNATVIKNKSTESTTGVTHASNSPRNSSTNEEKLSYNSGTNKKSANVVWDAFNTDAVITASRQSRLMMQKDRKKLLSSIKTKGQEKSLNDENVETKSVSLSKEDFLHMTVIGQFNLGFILARCRNHNLWILDQHACDEKFNFERFCKETVIHEQKLIAPLPLELSPSEEHCILEHMDVFERNGFRFNYDPENEPRHRLSLTALPHSGSGGDGKKAVQFDKGDVGALCAMLGADGTSSSDGYNSGFGSGADGSGAMGNNAVRRYAGLSGAQGIKSNGVVGSSIVRLPKAIAMFASRACRGSIMIGTALSHKEMNNVVEKLNRVEIPWNCPHGRPTMSHIRNLSKDLLVDDDVIATHVAGPCLSVLCDE